MADQQLFFTIKTAPYILTQSAYTPILRPDKNEPTVLQGYQDYMNLRNQQKLEGGMNPWGGASQRAPFTIPDNETQ